MTCYCLLPLFTVNWSRSGPRILLEILQTVTSFPEVATCAEVVSGREYVVDLLTGKPLRIPTEVLEIGAVQLPYNRTEQFSELTHEIIVGLKYVFQTLGDVIIFTATGTGAIEACIANLLDKDDRVLIVNGAL